MNCQKTKAKRNPVYKAIGLRNVGKDWLTWFRTTHPLLNPTKAKFALSRFRPSRHHNISLADNWWLLLTAAAVVAAAAAAVVTVVELLSTTDDDCTMPLLLVATATAPTEANCSGLKTFVVVVLFAVTCCWLFVSQLLVCTNNGWPSPEEVSCT